MAGWLTPFQAVRGYLDSISGDGSADPYTPKLHRLLQLFIAAGAASVLLALWGSLLLMRRFPVAARWAWLNWRHDVTELRTSGARLIRGEFVWLLALAAVAAALRLPWLWIPIRYDEAYSYLEYSSLPWFVTISKYNEPNNHVFYNLLTNFVIRATGPDPWALRLIPLLAGIALAPATCLLGAAVGGRRVGVLAGLLVAASSPLIDYSVNGRGYTLLCLLTVFCWLLAIPFRSRRNLTAGAGLVLLGALGLWTIPTMLFALGALWGWLLWDKRTARRREVLAVAAFTCAVAGALYLPTFIVGSANRAIPTEAAADLALRLQRTETVLREAYRLLLRDVPWACQIPMGLAAAAALWSERRSRPEFWKAAVANLAPLVLFSLLTALLPPARAWLYLIPLGAVVVAQGADWCARSCGRGQWVVLGGSIAAFAIAPGVGVFQHDAIRRSQETGALPAGEAIIQDLQPILGATDRIMAAAPASSPLSYYARRHGLSLAPFEWPRPGELCYVVVAVNYPQTLEDVLKQLGQTAHAEREFPEWKSYPSALVYRGILPPAVTSPPPMANDK
jgi:hypothetical protein